MVDAEMVRVAGGSFSMGYKRAGSPRSPRRTTGALGPSDSWGSAGFLARVDHGGPAAHRGLDSRAPRNPCSQESRAFGMP